MSIRIGANAIIIRDEHILVVEFQDESGPHFNLPGGGVDEGESIPEALLREVQEETCADITVGRLLLVMEYFPPHHENRYGTCHKAGLFFECFLKEESEPHMPEQPDDHQVGVRWIPLKELPCAPLLPNIGARLLRMLASPPQEELFFTDM